MARSILLAAILNRGSEAHGPAFARMRGDALVREDDRLVQAQITWIAAEDDEDAAHLAERAAEFVFDATNNPSPATLDGRLFNQSYRQGHARRSFSVGDIVAVSDDETGAPLAYAVIDRCGFQTVVGASETRDVMDRAYQGRSDERSDLSALLI